MPLAGFDAVELPAGERATVRIELAPRAFAQWAPEAAAWEVLSGTHEIRVGRSSRDLRLRATADVAVPAVR